MILKTVNINDLIPYENNPCKNDQAVEAVAESIRQCGYVAPIIVDDNMVVLAGHTRLKALKRLQWDKINIAIVEGLSEEQKAKYRLLDNKTSEFSEWDVEKLEKELENMDFDGFEFGFLLEEDEPITQIADTKADVPFTEVLNEEHNYVVLYFDNDVDWLQLLSIIDVEEKKNLSTRKDGKITKSMVRKSVGRVFKGREVLERMRVHYENFH